MNLYKYVIHNWHDTQYFILEVVTFDLYFQSLKITLLMILTSPLFNGKILLLFPVLLKPNLIKSLQQEKNMQGWF